MQSSKEIEICDLDLSIRATNCLSFHGINTIEDLLRLKEEHISCWRSMGKKTVEELKEKLRKHNLGLRKNEEELINFIISEIKDIQNRLDYINQALIREDIYKNEMG